MRKLWDAIWFDGGRGGADGNNYWRRLAPFHYIWVGVCLALMGAALGIAALAVGAVYPGLTDDSLFRTYFGVPLIIILNLLPGLLLTAFFYFATGRAWSSFLLTAICVLGVAIADFYKVSIRSETLSASDLGLVGEMLGVISRYTLRFSGRPRLALLAFAGGIVFSAAVLRGRLRSPRVRIIGAAATAAAIAVLLPTVYFNDTVAASLKNEEADINIWVEQQQYAARGVIYSFLHTVPDAFPQKPEGYDSRTAAQYLAEFEDGSIEPDRRVNIVAVMLEAYTDLSECPEIAVDPEVYAPLHKLEEESIHGRLVVNVFGGGTVDTERAFLTGYPCVEEYRTSTDSYVWFLRQNGYYAEGYHSGDSWFYNRKNVETALGMENYYFLSDYDSTDRGDRAFFERLRGLIDARDASTPYFNFSVTYQNHGAYISEYTGEREWLERGTLDEANFNIVNNYLTGIADTGERMLSFIDSLRDDPEPFVVVFFGDHKPYLDFAYDRMGINMDIGTAEGFFNYYTTPYIIWANDAAKAATGGDFTGEGGDISPCFLMDRIFEECGWGRDAYGGLVHDVSQRVSVVQSMESAAVVEGELTRSLDDADVRRLLWASYYHSRSFTYSGVRGY